MKEIIADAFFCRVFGEWIVLTQRPVYIEVSLTGIAGLKSLTVKTGLLLKARHKRGFWGNPASQSMIAQILDSGFVNAKKIIHNVGIKDIFVSTSLPRMVAWPNLAK